MAFDQGYGRGSAALTAAMTRAATQTDSVGAVLDVATYVDPLGFGDSRLVGRVAFAVAQERTLQFVVNHGRDNGTVAAVAEAIRGAQVGYGGLPPKLAAAVATASRERVGIDLERAAQRLVARNFPG